jgi:membrane protein implicated in regulation of membrane protease activity
MHVSPWNLTALAAFVAWFGGTGYLALTEWYLAAWMALLVAGLGGLIGWAVIYFFISKVLARGESRLDPADYLLEGTIAQVTQRIGEGRIGEIQYSKAGTRRSDGARSVDGSSLERGTEVVIVRYESGIAYVEPWQSFVEGSES